ncbi:hypothetical protein AX16_002736 [Volvariella volvacea WC 439]|nr:hypothetical protein AX16_002736 [Volvariella volvacea WC 439]
MATTKWSFVAFDGNTKPKQDKNPYARPGFGLPLTYVVEEAFPKATEMTITEEGGCALPLLTLREITMLRIMDAITDKPDWEKKILDTEITNKWREELKSAHGDVTELMFDWCLEELAYRAEKSYNTGYISIIPGVVKSDKMVDSDLNAQLRDAVRVLEDIPEGKKDWHPGSDEKVLDLVHPSLFPLVFGKSRFLEDSLTTLDDCIKRCGEGKVVPVPSKDTLYDEYSGKFQWLPCEVELGHDDRGVKAKITSYINNLHPERHRDLYGVIEKLIAKATPLWNLTLTELLNKASDISIPRIIYTNIYYADPDDRSTLYVPDAPVWFDPEPASDVKVVDLVNDFKNIQVIVKLANIHLTPEKPEYEGGTWHVEGQQNECIVSTALYYYDNENITPSHLAFRQQSDIGSSTFDDMSYEQDDHDWLSTVYGLQNWGPAVQQIGSIETREGRLLTFPNILQHQVQPFKLADPTKPGHRKILALFLVDPHVKIISTANIPCQRTDWWGEEFFKAKRTGEKSAIDKLPDELLNIIFSYVDGFPIRMEEAKKLRLELMEERKKFVLQQGEAFEATEISLCEH